MLERLFDTTDLHVSSLGLGCNNFGGRLEAAAAHKVVRAALDAGITLFDTADIYGNRGGSETILGQALGARRKDVVLVTTFCMPMDEAGKLRGGSARYAAAALEASLRRLKRDWIDLYYLHRPDPETPIAETLGALDKLIKDGKVRYIGCSNMSAAQIAEAQQVSGKNSWHRFVSAQDQYNLLSRQIEVEVIPAIAAHRLTLIPYFPLASGMLTGRYRPGAPIQAGTRMSYPRYSDRFLNDENFRILERLRAFAEKRGRSLLELAFGWLLSKPYVGCVIAGASTPEQVRQNAAAIDWRLSAAEMEEVDRLASKETVSN